MYQKLVRFIQKTEHCTGNRRCHEQPDVAHSTPQSDALDKEVAKQAEFQEVNGAIVSVRVLGESRTRYGRKDQDHCCHGCRWSPAFQQGNSRLR